MPDKAWKLDIQKTDHETAQSVQHVDQLLKMLNEAVDIARRVRLNGTTVLNLLDEAKVRGVIDAPEGLSMRERIAATDDGLPRDPRHRHLMVAASRRLLEVLPFVYTTEDLYNWLVEQLVGTRGGRRARNIMREPGVRVSGAIFAPMNGDDPKENGEALTLRIKTKRIEDPPFYMNLGMLISLAIFGSRVLTVVAPRAPDEYEDEDDDDDDYGYDDDDDDGPTGWREG